MIQKIRQQFPEYSDMPDDDLMDAIHQAHYSDMPREQFDQCCDGGQPDHEDLVNAAVTGEDSLNLQELDPTVKPAVKMTVKELTKHIDRIASKVAIIWNDAAYVIDPTAVDPTQAMADILSDNDSEILGYPQKGPMSAAVSKQGEIITHLPTMRSHALTKNIAWAASGEHANLLDKASRVSAAIKNGQQ